MIEQTEVTIGGNAYTITSLPASRALVLAARLAKALSGAGRGLRDVPHRPEDLQRLNEAINAGAIIEGLAANLEPEVFATEARRMVRESLVWPAFEGENAEAQFADWYEATFSRGHGDLLRLLWAILDHNYGPSLEWLKNALGPVLEGLFQAGPSERDAPSQEETRPLQATAS